MHVVRKNCNSPEKHFESVVGKKKKKSLEDGSDVLPEPLYLEVLQHEPYECLEQKEVQNSVIFSGDVDHVPERVRLDEESSSSSFMLIQDSSMLTQDSPRFARRAAATLTR
jgi:hypothetical protein